GGRPPMRRSGSASQPRRGPVSSRARRSGPLSPDRPVRLRLGIGRVTLLATLAVVALQLLYIQSLAAPALSAQAASQRTHKETEAAVRGPITDRHGNRLAFTITANALTFQPVRVRQQLADAKKTKPKAPDPDQRLKDIAKFIHEKLGDSG